jgi:asparagine synthase (glutamine-hydrolysing)
MRWSIESRVPFLTTDIAEFLLTLPEHYLISPGGETKHVFRAAMRGIVPDAILDRRDKIGFATPEQSWLRTLDDSALDWTGVGKQIPFLNIHHLRLELRAAMNGHRRIDFPCWRLMNFCRWVSLSNPVIN